MIKIGKESVEGAFKLYKGIAAVNVLAVNPNKEAIKELTGREREEEPVYLGKTEEGKDQVYLDFYLKTNPEAPVNNGIEIPLTMRITITKDFRKSQGGKVQVIDKYGNTAWATKEDYESKSIPVHSTGKKANITNEYRLAYQGEESLINFLRNWLNIPTSHNYVKGEWVLKDNLEECEINLDMDKLFKGNVSEIADVIKMAPNYLVKVVVGIQTNNEGREYQRVYTKSFLKNSITNYSKIDAEIASFQAAGGAPSTVFSVEPLHENVVTATSFKDNSTETPFDENTGEANTPWD